jgi:hypothetical protein
MSLKLKNGEREGIPWKKRGRREAKGDSVGGKKVG